MEVQITGKVQRSWELSLDHSWKRGGGRDVDREKKKREISSINIKNQNN